MINGLNTVTFLQAFRVACRILKPAPWDTLEPVMLFVTPEADPGQFLVYDNRPQGGTKCAVIHPVLLTVVRKELKKALDELSGRGWPPAFMAQTMEARAVVSNDDMARVLIWIYENEAARARKVDPVRLVPKGRRR